VIRTLARATVKRTSGLRGRRHGAIGLCGLAAVGLAVLGLAVLGLAVLCLAALCLAGSWPAPAAAQMPAPPAATTPAGTGAPPVASDARLAGDDKQTRLVVDLTRKIELRYFTLPDPYRVVIDIPEVTFRLAPRTGEHGRGLVKAFRYGLVMPGGSRIVIDATGPVRVLKAFVVDPADDQPARMVVDLAPVDRETFLRAAAIDNRLPRLADPPPTPPTRHDRDPQTARPADPRPVVVLDPGHGGIDTGTHAASGELEKNLALEFATMLRDKLEKTGKYRLAMTRTDDTFVPLAERVRFARLRQAQLFISIHCDALARGAGAAEGASVYTLSEKASDAEAARLADAENRADVIAGVNLASEPSEIADILIDLAQRETNAFSANFARNVVSALRAAARLHKNPLKSAGFRVLKAPDVPSVLIELGYISDAGDLKQLLSASWRSRTGDAIMQAVNTYFATRLAGAGSGGTTGSR
jgi:N-acetylmuramoyl-L-alanine amidase